MDAFGGGLENIATRALQKRDEIYRHMFVAQKFDTDLNITTPTNVFRVHKFVIVKASSFWAYEPEHSTNPVLVKEPAEAWEALIQHACGYPLPFLKWSESGGSPELEEGSLRLICSVYLTAIGNNFRAVSDEIRQYSAMIDDMHQNMISKIEAAPSEFSNIPEQPGLTENASFLGRLMTWAVEETRPLLMADTYWATFINTAAFQRKNISTWEIHRTSAVDRIMRQIKPGISRGRIVKAVEENDYDYLNSIVPPSVYVADEDEGYWTE